MAVGDDSGLMPLMHCIFVHATVLRQSTKHEKIPARFCLTPLMQLLVMIHICICLLCVFGHIRDGFRVQSIQIHCENLYSASSRGDTQRRNEFVPGAKVIGDEHSRHWTPKCAWDGSTTIPRVGVLIKPLINILVVNVIWFVVMCIFVLLYKELSHQTAT